MNTYVKKEEAHKMFELYKYDNPFVSIRRNSLGLYIFMKNNDEIVKYIDFFSNLDIEDVLRDIEKNHFLRFNDNEISEIIECDEEINKMLIKSLKM